MPAQDATDSTTAQLTALAREAELLAAHHAEYIPDGHRVDDETCAALRAAASFGRAIGLRQAAELIEQTGATATRDG